MDDKLLADALLEIALNRDNTGTTLSGTQCADIAAAALMAAGLGGNLPDYIALKFGAVSDSFDDHDNPDEMPA